MKILTCPINGPRPIQEFVFGGEFREMPDPDSVTDPQWTHYVYDRNGAPGVKREWWHHLPSGTWFIAERDTGTNDVKGTYLYTDEVEHG